MGWRAPAQILPIPMTLSSQTIMHPEDILLSFQHFQVYFYWRLGLDLWLQACDLHCIDLWPVGLKVTTHLSRWGSKPLCPWRLSIGPSQHPQLSFYKLSSLWRQPGTYNLWPLTYDQWGQGWMPHSHLPNTPLHHFFSTDYQVMTWNKGPMTYWPMTSGVKGRISPLSMRLSARG